MINKIRELEDICIGEGELAFRQELLGSQYCSIKPTSGVVQCYYRSPFLDQNNLYTCQFQEFMETYFNYEEIINYE